MMNDLENAIRIHAQTDFVVSNLSQSARYALRRADVTISAAGTMKGVTARDIDKMLDNVKAVQPLTTAERIAVKLELSARGILFAPRPL